MDAVCPHKGGTIADGQVDADVVVCPLHLTPFSLTDGCSTTGAAPLQVYPVAVEDGVVVVTVPDAVRQSDAPDARAADGKADDTYEDLASRVG